MKQRSSVFEMIGAYTVPGRVMGDSRTPNGLPWNRMLREDMRHFRSLTRDNTIIVGAHTEQYVRPLHGKFGRHVVVVASRPLESPCIVKPTLDDALALVASDSTRYGKPIIGGGAYMFQQAFRYLDILSRDDPDAHAVFHATEVKRDFSGDIRMPEFPDGWIEYDRISINPDVDGGPAYDFVTYRYN